MFTASRHVQRLAGNFLDDVDDFQRASRAADRRAMSHFDEASGQTHLMRPRRSISISRITTRPSNYYHVEGPRVRATSAEPRYTTYTSGVRPVTVVGSRYHHYSPYYYYRYYPRYYVHDTYYPSTATYYNDYPFYSTSACKYWPYTSKAHYSHYLPSTTYYTRSNGSVYDYTLPTSGLRASVPSWDIGYRPLSLSRWYSYSDLLDSSPLEMRMQDAVTNVPIERIPRARGPDLKTTPLETEIYYRHPQTTTGYRYYRYY